MAAVALPGTARAGACARPDLPTRALTAPGAELAKGGGVLVSMEDAAKAPAMTFSIGGKRAAATKTVIGAGLVVYTPPEGAGATALQLAGKDLVTVRRGGDAKPLAAPKVAKVQYASYTGRRGTSVSVTVDITGALPSTAVAVAIYDEPGALRSWGATANAGPSAKTTTIAVYGSGSCMVQPDGFAPSPTGDKVQVAYLDASGRVSAKTAVTVTAMPQPKTAPFDPGY